MRRNCEMKIRFTREELDELTQKASRSKYSREGFCRKVLSGCTLKEAPPIEYYALIREVKRLGSNINQLLLLANARGHWQAQALADALDDYRDTIRMIWDAFSDTA